MRLFFLGPPTLLAAACAVSSSEHGVHLQAATELAETMPRTPMWIAARFACPNGREARTANIRQMTRLWFSDRYLELPATDQPGIYSRGENRLSFMPHGLELRLDNGPVLRCESRPTNLETW